MCVAALLCTLYMGLFVCVYCVYVTKYLYFYTFPTFKFKLWKVIHYIYQLVAFLLLCVLLFSLEVKIRGCLQIRIWGNSFKKKSRTARTQYSFCCTFTISKIIICKNRPLTRNGTPRAHLILPRIHREKKKLK